MRVLSGIQPTGIPHLGNYFGALKQWVELQDKGHDCFYSIVNQHAITIPQDPSLLSKRTLSLGAILMAVGLDPEKSAIFVQSDVPAHAQLAWILNCLSPMGVMERMIQFKEKSEKNPSAVNVGLFAYPIIMAADILLYKTNLVPVGIDQAQHLELTRELANKFNNRFKPIFPEPKTLHTKTTKVVGLDGSAKMSKSANNYISLIESRDNLWKKLGPAVTDPARVKKSDPGNPDICNIYALDKLFADEKDLKWAYEGCRSAGIGCIEHKKKLFEKIDAFLTPIRDKYAELMANPETVREALNAGAQKANTVAQETLDQVYDLIGFKY